MKIFSWQLKNSQLEKVIAGNVFASGIHQHEFSTAASICSESSLCILIENEISHFWAGSKLFDNHTGSQKSCRLARFQIWISTVVWFQWLITIKPFRPLLEKLTASMPVFFFFFCSEVTSFWPPFFKTFSATTMIKDDDIILDKPSVCWHACL